MNTISSKVLTIDFGLVKKYIYVVKPITVTQLYIPVVKLNIVEKYNQPSYMPIDSDFHSQR